MKRNMFRLSIAALTLVLFSIVLRPAIAWEEDKVARLRYYYVPFSELDKETGDISMNVLKTSFWVPVALSESVVFLPGLAYNGLYLDYKDLTFSYPMPDGGVFAEKDLPHNLHVIDLILGGYFEFDEKWGAFAVLYPGIHSDLDDLEGDDIYFSAAALATYRFSENFLLQAGFYYDDSFGYPQLLPAFGGQWRISDGMTLEALLPQFMVFAYQPAPVLVIGLKFNVDGHQYRLSKGEPWKDTVVKYTQILAGPLVDFYLTENLVLRLEGGVVVNREFEFRDDDTSSKLYDGDIKDSGYVGGSLSLQY